MASAYESSVHSIYSIFTLQTSIDSGVARSTVTCRTQYTRLVQMLPVSNTSSRLSCINVTKSQNWLKPVMNRSYKLN